MNKVFSARFVSKALVFVSLLSLAACQKPEVKVSASKHENLKELTNLLINKEQMLKAMEMLMGQLVQMGKVNQLQTKEMLKEISEKFDSEETRKAFMDIYDKHFNDTEVAEILAFYKSATGKKTMEKMPEVMSEASQIGMKIAQDVMIKNIPQEEAPKAPAKPVAPKAKK